MTILLVITLETLVDDATSGLGPVLVPLSQVFLCSADNHPDLWLRSILLRPYRLKWICRKYKKHVERGANSITSLKR